MKLDKIEELNKLETQIKETQKILEDNEKDKSKIEELKIHRIVLGVLAILFLGSSIWLFLNGRKNAKLNANIKENFIFISTDSIRFYKDVYQKFQINSQNNTTNKLTISNQKIIYNVQLGAYQDFKLTSTDLMNLKEFTKDGYTKFSIGNFSTYNDALALKQELKKLGFADSFIIANSFGKQINIEEALSLSNEIEYLQ